MDTQTLQKNVPNENADIRFVIISKENGFFKTSPFLIQKLITNVAGPVKDTKRLGSGDLLIEVKSPNQVKPFLDLKRLGNFEIVVKPHQQFNTSRGVISEQDLLDVPEDEFVDELKDQKVIKAKRITIKKEGTPIDTKHVILTFNTPNLPKYIQAGYIRCSVRPYIPNPLRCFKCQRFGHSQVSCRGKLTCARCAGTDHNSDSCNADPKCINCAGNHPSYSRNCPKWAIEKEIQTVKVKNNISFLEARKIVSDRMPRKGVSYASVLKKTVNISTQTDNEITVSIPLSSTSKLSTTILSKGIKHRTNINDGKTVKKSLVSSSKINSQRTSESSKNQDPTQDSTSKKVSPIHCISESSDSDITDMETESQPTGTNSQKIGSSSQPPPSPPFDPARKVQRDGVEKTPP